MKTCMLETIGPVRTALSITVNRFVCLCDLYLVFEVHASCVVFNAGVQDIIIMFLAERLEV